MHLIETRSVQVDTLISVMLSWGHRRSLFLATIAQPVGRSVREREICVWKIDRGSCYEYSLCTELAPCVHKVINETNGDRLEAT